tara:strand:- start:560 stop:784 length:225 start_codon:yes stop_codon:yes gene_type:complete
MSRSNNKFKIHCYFNDDSVELTSVRIEGGFKMPSLEMSDLLTDVINDLKEKQSNSFTSYVKSIKTRKKGINAKR